MAIHLTGKLFSLSVILISGHALAAQNDALLNFKFIHQSNINNSEYSALVDTDLIPETGLGQTTAKAIKFVQYDATWTYPWETKSVNIDLGVTLRHLDGLKMATDGLDDVRFQGTLPLLHASALYNFSFEGLSAGIEGNHLKFEGSQILDYRAKVSYEWRKGFGMQGGWQHQQFSLKQASENTADYEKTGPFIDFYLNF